MCARVSECTGVCVSESVFVHEIVYVCVRVCV